MPLLARIGNRTEIKDTDPDAPLGYLTRIIDKRVRTHGCFDHFGPHLWPDPFRTLTGAPVAKLARSHACDVAFLLQRELSAAGA